VFISCGNIDWGLVLSPKKKRKKKQ